MQVAVALLLAVLQRILRRVAQQLWDELWAELFKVIAQAELEWQEAGQGSVKKEWALARAMEFLEKRVRLNVVQRQIARFVISKVIDAVVASINAELGHDWTGKAKEFQKKLADLLPFVQ